MIEDLGDVNDPFGRLAQSQHQLKILYFIEGRVQPTNLI